MGRSLAKLVRSLLGPLGSSSSSLTRQELFLFVLLRNRGPEKGNDSEKSDTSRRAGLGLEPELLTLRPAFLPLFSKRCAFLGCLSGQEGVERGSVVGPLEELF